MKITILYATQSGNAEFLAESLFLQLLAAKFSARLLSMEQFQNRQLMEEDLVLFVVSTTGDGNVPEDAWSLYAYLQNQKQDLSSLRYSVLALGDKSYTHYCQAGRDFDVLLLTAGALRIIPRMDCDADFASTAEHWIMLVLHFCKSLNI